MVGAEKEVEGERKKRRKCVDKAKRTTYLL